MAIKDADVYLLKGSSFFDETWYLEQYPDVQKLSMDAAKHYLWIGAKLGRDPSPYFSTKEYELLNNDVKAKGINPLIHYLRWGQREGRPYSFEGVPVASDYYPGSGKWKADRPCILLCAHEANKFIFGGERSFVDMLVALRDIGYNIYVTVPQKENLEYLNILQDLSNGVFAFPYSLWLKNKPTDEYAVSEFAKIISEYNVDAVYVNTMMLREPQIAAKRLGLPSLCHVRELIELDEHLQKRIGKGAKAAVNDVVNRSTHIIANSKKTLQAFAGHNAFHAPNIVDTNLFNIDNVVDERLVFGIVSSNIPKKGVQDFIEVAKKVWSYTDKAVFYIIGPENNYTATLKAGDLPPNLEFRGYAAQPIDAIKQINVLISLSKFAESFGRTIAEALSARRPVISYERGAIPELIDNDTSGYLVTFEDIDAVVEKVLRFVNDCSLVLRMGEAGRDRMCREFSQKVLQERLTTIFSEVFSEQDLAASLPSQKVSVIVPVYNAPEDVSQCLESVLKHTDPSLANILVIDDGSSSPLIPEVLERYRNVRGFEVISNDKNLGYTLTINKGVELAKADDVVLLNSDTIVTPGWLESMKEVAYSSRYIATVTAMSDNSGAFSFPEIHTKNAKPDLISYDLWAKAIISHTDRCSPVDVPTGNGFCLYIRRQVFNDIGMFDSELFPRGYGEENEFCMRALAKGWRHVISPKTYIFHGRSKSFVEEKNELMEKGNNVLIKKYPSYLRKVKKAFESEPMQRLRLAASLAYTEYYKSGQYQEWLETADVELVLKQKYSRWNEVLLNWNHLEYSCKFRSSTAVSIVICAYNNPSLTKKCIASVLQNTDVNEFEIILVNNGSNVGASELLKKLCLMDSRVTYVDNGENLNFALGNNIGFAKTNSKKVIFLNNDTEVKSGWLEPLVLALDDPKVMGAQPKLLYPDGRLQCVGVVFSDKNAIGYPIYSNFPGNGEIGNQSRNYRAITAACMIVRAEAFIKAKGFDPIFVNGQEDVDLCLRMAGVKPLFRYVPESVVIHHEGKTSGRGKFVSHNRKLFVDRWVDAYQGDDHFYYRKDGFTVKDYSPDRSEQEIHIAAWRPAELVKLV